MSTLKVTTIQDTAGGNSSTSEEIYSGRAKAWVNFNGTSTVAIRAQFNVSSITDNATGNYTVNFTTAMPDANYSLALAVSGDADFNNRSVATQRSGNTSSSFRVTTFQTVAQTLTDEDVVCANVFR